MILKQLKFLFLLLICSAGSVYAQYGRTTTTNTNTNPFVQGDTSLRKKAKTLTDDQLLDTLRKRDEQRGDTVIYTSKFIRVTNERLFNDSTQIIPLDTTLTNFENYSVLYQARHPTIGLGNLGLAYRPLLFEPSKTIGFDVGLHFLDAYIKNPEDQTYYRARTPFTQLYYVNGALKEQVFKVTHTQNIKPNWNAGFNFDRIGSVGFYQRQKSDDLEASIFTWYESKSRRYNLFGNLTFNNLKAPENGSILNDTIFNKSTGEFSNSSTLSKTAEPVRLYNSRDNWRDNSFYIKQIYYIGHATGLNAKPGSSTTVIPTQRVSYTFDYNRKKYTYLQDEADLYNVFPRHLQDTLYSRDSLAVTHIKNEFTYSFFLRGNSLKFVQNELKLDLGLSHDYYNYSQYIRDTLLASTVNRQRITENYGNFQDITLKARLGYNLSDRAALDVNLQQITLGREFGDYLYDAKLNVKLSNKIGRVLMEAYTQSNKPPLVFDLWYSSHYQFKNDFSKIKTTSLMFNYINEKLQLDAKAEYFLLNNYLYLGTTTEYSNNAQPMQEASAISLLKLSLGKNFSWRGFYLDNYLVYQKNSNANVLRTPDFYTYNSFYYKKRFFNVLSTSFGFTARYNTKYLAPAYAPGIGFYNNSNISFQSYPVVDLFVKGTLKRTNLFLKYNYANQGLLSKGYYTVVAPGVTADATTHVGYPMQDALLVFGVSWNFYD